MRLRLALIGLFLLCLCGLQSGSIAAAAPNDAVITNPTDGQVITHGLGYHGPLTVQWNTTGNFAIVVTGPGGYSDEIDASPAAYNVGNSYLFPITPLSELGTYQITITNSDTSEVVFTSTFVAKDYDLGWATHPSSALTGWTGPITATWSHLEDPSNTYEVQFDDIPVCTYAGTLVPGEVTHCTLSSAPLVGTHFVNLYDRTTDYYLDGSVITIDPHLTLSESLPRTAFYPLVRDGYKDSIGLGYTLDEDAKVTFEAKNAAGKIIRHDGPHSETTGSHTWKWTGRTDTGRIKRVGYYWLRAIATAHGETKKGNWQRISAKTALLTKQGSASRLGRNFSSAGKSNCLINKNYWNDGDVFLDCWDGSAHATYSFAVPSSTYSVTTGSSTKQHCCGNGTTSRTTTRPSASRVQVAFNVTGWASLAINSVSIHYAYKKRI
jgi:hypothetical protein